MVRMAAEAVAEDGDLDLRALALALWRRKSWILWPTLLVAVLTTIGVNMMTPRYRSEARLLYDGRENTFLRPEVDRTLNAERPPADAETLTSQVQIVLSRQLALDVIRQLKLGDLPEFDPVLRETSILQHILSILGLARDWAAMSPEERVLEVLVRPPHRVFRRQVPGHRRRVPVVGPDAGGEDHQCHRQHLPAHGTEPADGSGARRQHVALRRDRAAAPPGRRRRSQGRSIPLPHQPPGRHQQHDAEQPAARRDQLAGGRRAGREGRLRDPRQDHPRHAAPGRDHRAFRRRQFRADPAPVRAARHAARPARRAVDPAPRPPPPHHGTQGPGRRPRQADPGRGRQARPHARERGAHRERQGRRLERQPRHGQEAGGHHQRAGRPAAGAGARGEGAARPPRVLSRQVPRDHRARNHRHRAGGRQDHLGRDRVEHALFPEKSADRIGGDADHLHPVLRPGGDRGAAARVLRGSRDRGPRAARAASGVARRSRLAGEGGGGAPHGARARRDGGAGAAARTAGYRARRASTTSRSGCAPMPRSAAASR